MKLFVSYAHDDMPFCRGLVRLLDAHEVWFDQNLKGGEDWWQRILIQLDWCQGLIYLLSPTSTVSEYCQREAAIALNNKKIIIPVIIHRRTQIPDILNHIQYIDLSEGLENVTSVVQLMNALFEAERTSRRSRSLSSELMITDADISPPMVENSNNQRHPSSLPYNYTFKLDQRGRSERTKYTYIRWVCDYLERMVGQPRVESSKRALFLSNLSVGLIQDSLTIAQVNAWLGLLKRDGVSKLSVAKSAIVAFAETLVDDGLIEPDLLQKLRAIQATKLNIEKRPRRIITYAEINTLLNGLNTNSKLDQRNAALVSLLLVLRSGEVATLKWSDVSLLGERVNLRSPISGQLVQLPKSTQKYLSLWYETLRDHTSAGLDEDSFVIRRFLHGDNVMNYGVTTTSINKILTMIVENSGIRKISPEDLRVSARKLMQQKGRELL